MASNDKKQETIQIKRVYINGNKSMDLNKPTPKKLYKKIIYQKTHSYDKHKINVGIRLCECL